MTTDRNTVTGVFNSPEHADSAYRSLRDRGYGDEDIHVMMSEDTKKKYYSRENVEIEHGSKAMEGAGTGAAIGGTAGGILGALAAVGTTALIPGIGLAIAGPLAGALAGAGAGGAAGSVLGALVGAGIPEDRAKIYEDSINDGGIVVGARTKSGDDASYYSDEFARYGGQHVRTY